MPYRALLDAAPRPSTAGLLPPLLAIFLALSCLLAAAAAGAAEKPALGGRVVDHDQQSLAGATVELWPALSRWREGRGELAGEADQPAAVTTTDEGGHFRLTAPGDGFWEMVITAPERVPARREVGPVDGAGAVSEFTVPEITLVPAVPVVVRVLDSQDVPIQGARVTAMADGDTPRRNWARRRSLARTWRQAAVTGEDGRATVVRQEGETLGVSVAADGFAPVELEEEGGATVTVRLGRGEPITVEVRDAGGDPVPEALLRFGESYVALGLTGDDGRLTFGRQPGAGLVLMAVSPQGHWRRHEVPAEPAAAAAAEEGTAGEGAEEELEVVELPPLVTLTGRTLEETERSPVAAAWVWVSGYAHAAVRSDSRGNFTLASSESESTRLQADASGYAATFARPREEQVAGGEPITMLLPATAAATGRVVDGDGEPVADARVRAVPQGSRRSRRVNAGEAVATGADGRFRLDELSADTPHSLKVVHADHAPASLPLGALTGGTLRQGLEIVLGPANIAFGRVVDLDETPVAGAQVSLIPVPETNDMAALFRAVRNTFNPHSSTSDGEGRFEIGGLGDGRFDLTAEAADFAPLTVPGVELPAGGGRVDLGTLFLEPGLSLVGEVVNSDGEAVAQARVSATGDRGVGLPKRFGPRSAEEGVRTGPDGRFVLDDLARGSRLTVQAEAEGYTPARMHGVEVPGEEPLRIVMEPSVTLSGVVTDASGGPVEGARVSLRSEPGAGAVGRTAFAGGRSDEEGRFTVEGVTPGVLVVSVWADGFLSYERTGLEVAAGEEPEELRIILEPGATIGGRVIDALGNPLVEARVSVVRDPTDANHAGVSSRRTDADGVYRLQGVPTGEQSLEAEHRGHQRQVRDLTVVAGENRLDFRLQPGASVSGRVVDEGGAPVAGARVSASVAGSGPRLRRDGEITDEAGAFELEGMQPGRYDLTAQKDGYAVSTLEEPVEVTGGPVQGVEILLNRGALVTGRLLGAELEDLAGASVMAGIFGRRDRMPIIGSVDYEGRFRIEGVPAGDWTLMALLSDGMPAGQEQLTVAPGQREASVDIDLGAGEASLRGSLRIGGEPVPSTYLILTGRDTAGVSGGRTDHQGRFEIRGLEDGTYELEISRPGATRRRTVEIRGDTELDIDIEVSSVSGVVIAEGEPVEGARVGLELADGSPGQYSSGRSDPAGRFRLTGVAAGSYRLRASAQGYAPGETLVTVEEGIPLAGVEVRLQRAGGLELVVRGPFGPPPERVRVAAVDPARASGPGAAGDLPLEGGPPTVYAERPPVGEGGRVRLEGLPQGSWDLLVTDFTTAVARRRVTSPGPPVTITLEPSGLLTVRVPDLADVGQLGRVELTGADGRPFIGLGWRGNVQSNWALHSGEARVRNLPAGRWTVTATTPDGRTWTGSVITAGGAAAEVELR